MKSQLFIGGYFCSWNYEMIATFMLYAGHILLLAKTNNYLEEFHSRMADHVPIPARNPSKPKQTKEEFKGIQLPAMGAKIYNSKLGKINGIAIA